MNLMTSLAKWYAGAALPEKKNVRGGTSRVGFFAQAVVEHDDVERVQELPLVLVDALDVRVEDRLGIDHLSRSGLEPAGEPHLGLALGSANGAAERLVFGQRLELLELLEIGDPAVADGVRDHPGERRIREQEEAPLRDAVRLVVEPAREERGKVGHDGLREQVRVERRHTVGAVRADDGEVRHADLPRLALLDEAHARGSCLITGETRAHVVKEAAVDLVDDLEVPRQQHLEPGQRPLLERFGQQRVVRVRERALREIPGLVPSELRLVEEDPHQLRDRERRVRVVQLHRDFVGQRGPVVAGGAEAANRVGDRAGHQEVLLQEAQPLALRWSSRPGRARASAFRP